MRLLNDSLHALAAMALIAVIAACSSPAEDTTSSGSNFIWEQASQNGHFSVRIEPQAKSIPIGEYHEWTLSVRDSSNLPVTAARISLNGGMPSHGHGLPSQPQVTELGDGLYRIEGMLFNMGGSWMLKFRVMSATAQDTAQFKIELAL